jgi:hypothetical protein
MEFSDMNHDPAAYISGTLKGARWKRELFLIRDRT